MFMLRTAFVTLGSAEEAEKAIEEVIHFFSLLKNQSKIF